MTCFFLIDIVVEAIVTNNIPVHLQHDIYAKIAK